MKLKIDLLPLKLSSRDISPGRSGDFLASSEEKSGLIRSFERTFLATIGQT